MRDSISHKYAGDKMHWPRKQQILDHAESIADQRDQWIERNSAYYQSDRDYMRFLVPAGARVLDFGCGTGDLLADLAPSLGVGVDLSPKMVELARQKYPDLQFHVGDAEDAEFIKNLGGPFDYIVLSDTIGMLNDIERTLDQLHSLCTRETRIVIAYYAQLWEPVLSLAEALRMRMPQPPMNFISIASWPTPSLAGC